MTKSLVHRAVQACCCFFALLLGACQHNAPSAEPSTDIASAYRAAGLDDHRAAEILLQRFTYGARPGELESLLTRGLDEWFTEQVTASLSEASLQRQLAGLDAANWGAAELAAHYPAFSSLSAHIRRFEPGLLPGRDEPVDFPVIAAIVKEYAVQNGLGNLDSAYLPQQNAQHLIYGLYARNQLREVMVDFWQRHFHVSGEHFGAKRWIWSLEKEVLRSNALGQFSALLKGANQHPALLAYYQRNAKPSELESNTDNLPEYSTAQARFKALSTVSSVNAKTELQRAKKLLAGYEAEQDLILKREFWPRTGPNLNWARVILQQHSLGPEVRLADADVMELARMLTGWAPADYGVDDRWFDYDFASIEALGFVHRGGLWFRADRHDARAKRFLGRDYAPGGGLEEGEQALTDLAKERDTARYISGKLLRFFAGSNTHSELNDQLAEVFIASDGDIAQVLQAMVRSPAFWSLADQHSRSKTPERFVISALRAAGAGLSTSNTSAEREVIVANEMSPAKTASGAQSAELLVQWLGKLGQSPYAYLDEGGYPDTGEYWFEPASLLGRYEFVRALAENRLAGVNAQVSEQLLTQLLSPEFQAD